MTSVRERVAQRMFERKALHKGLPFCADWVEMIERLIRKDPSLEAEITPGITPLSRARGEAERKVKFGLIKM